MTQPNIPTLVNMAQDTQFTYTFSNFFHPFVGEMMQRLNQQSLPGLMDPLWQDRLTKTFFEDLYHPTRNSQVHVDSYPKEVDIKLGGPYASYNWELFFHLPLTIAVHLSKTQRFAEAQHWFHYIFDPTSNDQTVAPPYRFWTFLGFRKPDHQAGIDEVIRLLSIPPDHLSPTERESQRVILKGYNDIRNKPFQPHAVARARHLAYQYCVVMKYLDNLIAWGDHLFQQDTVESINEATQRYVLVSNILGPRPQRISPQGTVRARTFAQLKSDGPGLGPIGNALVALEGQITLNLAGIDSGSASSRENGSSPLFGIGRTLYFCIPRNDKLLGYWDMVGDRLFKIRHCMNIAGVVRPLALFDPPFDPGLLVRAAAVGIDIGRIVTGQNQPVGPVRSLFLIQKALELCGEVRGLGSALLSALEKGDTEHLALIRQSHDIQIQQMTQEVRFLQWKSAQEATKSLLTSRQTALERLTYYRRVLDLPADANAPALFDLDHRELNESNFDQAYRALVEQYNKTLTIQQLPPAHIVDDKSAAQQSGASGQGRLYLNRNESIDLHDHADRAAAARVSAAGVEALTAVLSILPNIDLAVEFWGIGGRTKIKVGDFIAHNGRAISSGFNIWAQIEESQGHYASKTASYGRRADEWILQYNLAARELMQIGRQILTSLIAEQIAHHEYLIIQQQIKNAQEVSDFLNTKFTNEELYGWMQGEISRLYYEYYRFAVETARKAERTMKQELMRPELDSQEFVKYNYWDGGRKGLLTGEALYLDVKRMEIAYHDNNKRELELIKHVSLRQLNPVALLTLKATGTCQVTIPEWLYDLDNPGHYMRRIKSVALSIPSVIGPYSSVNCTVSLLRSSVRKSPMADNSYLRQPDDKRFADYNGAIQSIVTSAAQNDSGMFETNLRDERFLPFEGVGAESTWKLDLPNNYRAFDYNTISDVILHIRYTARQGITPKTVEDALDNLFQQANQSNFALLFSLRHDFPTEWSAFVGDTNRHFTILVRKNFFPYFTKRKSITIAGFELYGLNETAPLEHRTVGNQQLWETKTNELRRSDEFTFDADGDDMIPTRVATTQVFLVIRYTLSG